MGKAKKKKWAEIELHDEATFERLSGLMHDNLRVVADLLKVQVGGRGKVLYLEGEPWAVAVGESLFKQLGRLAAKGREFTAADLMQATNMLQADPKANLVDLFSETLVKTRTGHPIGPKGPGQRSYVHSIRDHDLVIGVGPAGTGKTYLAMTMAVADLLSEKVSRIILTRPAVEAGERLGFLPGNMEEKVLPYLRPLYDAMFDLLGRDRAEEMVAHGTIEVAPLAFMRGRTLNDAFVILDEAQNTTSEQMKMFLTRLGFGSKMVVTGDVTQIDLPRGMTSGLIDAIRVLRGMKGMAICELSERDVVRHPLVGSVVRAYEKAEKNVNLG